MRTTVVYVTEKQFKTLTRCKSCRDKLISQYGSVTVTVKNMPYLKLIL